MLRLSISGTVILTLLEPLSECVEDLSESVLWFSFAWSLSRSL